MMTSHSTEKKPPTLHPKGRLSRWLKDEYAVGLDLTDDYIAAAYFGMHGGKPRLRNLIAEPYDPELSEHDLARFIHSFWKRNKLPTWMACTCLHSSSLIVRPFVYTNVLSDELTQVLNLEAEEALQLPAADIALSWQLNPPPLSGPKISGALVAAPRRIVSRHIRLMQSAGLYPVNVDATFSAALNLYNFLHPQPGVPVTGIITLTAHMAEIIILSAGSIYPRILYSSGQSGWTQNPGHLIESIESALLHFQLKVKGEPVQKLLLSGGPDESGFLQKMKEALPVPIERWNPLEKNEIPLAAGFKKTGFAQMPGAMNLTTVLGLGLQRPRREW